MIQRYRCGDFVEPPIEDHDGAHVRFSDHQRIVKEKDAEIERLKAQLAARPRSKSKKQKEEDSLRQSDLTAQLAERDNIEYGHHESLPRGEHVARRDREV